MAEVLTKQEALRALDLGEFDKFPIHNPRIECASREQIRAIQLAKLIEQVKYTYERVPWYQKKMDEMGVSPSDIKTLDDIRKLPFTDKSVLRLLWASVSCCVLLALSPAFSSPRRFISSR